jgi:hypothetical protein
MGGGDVMGQAVSWAHGCSAQTAGCVAAGAAHGHLRPARWRCVARGALPGMSAWRLGGAGLAVAGGLAGEAEHASAPPTPTPPPSASPTRASAARHQRPFAPSARHERLLPPSTRSTTPSHRPANPAPAPRSTTRAARASGGARDEAVGGRSAESKRSASASGVACHDPRRGVSGGSLPWRVAGSTLALPPSLRATQGWSEMVRSVLVRDASDLRSMRRDAGANHT